MGKKHFLILLVLIVKPKSIIDVTVLSRGYLIKLKNYGLSRGGGSKGKVPSGRGMDIFWNYTIHLVHRPPPPSSLKKRIVA